MAAENTQVREAFNSGISRPYAWRVAQITAIKRLLDEQEPSLCKALCRDLGKSSFEANYTELDLVRNSCDYMLANLKQLMTPSHARLPWYVKAKATISPEPLGAVLIFSAWNYPLLLALDPLVAALAAGNTVVLKPAELAKSTSSLLKNLLPNYVDPRAVKVLEGDRAVGAMLIEQKWDKIFYTGSPTIGKVIMAAAAKHLTPVTLELGAKCPVIIDKTADIDMAAHRVAGSKWMVNAGQACIAPDYILVQNEVADLFIEALQKALANFLTPLPETSEVDPTDVTVPHIINREQFQRQIELLRDAGEENVIYSLAPPSEDTLMVMPTIVRNPPMESRLMQEEIFGPILPVVAVTSMKEAIEVVNSKPKPLALYVFTKDKDAEREVAERTSSGSLLINDVGIQFQMDSIPFGGVGESGIGSYHGKYGFETFTHMKPVLSNHKDTAKNEDRTRYPPYSKKSQSILRACLRNRSFFHVLLLILGLKKT